ncbi:butyrate--CoA ligase AAE11, peroxisomal-like protein, partial [Tanacetum coccineum]
WQTKWNQLPKDHQARLKARQGVSILTLTDVDVKNKDTMENVPHDGITIGEIVLRGSNIMKGYLKDEKDCQSLSERMVLDYFTGV